MNERWSAFDLGGKGWPLVARDFDLQLNAQGLRLIHSATKPKVDATKKSKSGSKAKENASSGVGGVTNLGPSFGQSNATTGVCTRLILLDPFDNSDPFGGPSGAGTPSLDASVGGKSDKIHIRMSPS